MIIYILLGISIISNIILSILYIRTKSKISDRNKVMRIVLNTLELDIRKARNKYDIR